jgi:predicted nucleic-acid-binding protein
MIGVDTNVLLRLVIVDDEKQNALARDFFAQRSRASPARVSLVVMAEFCWVLVRKFKFGFEQVVEVIRSMLSSDDFVIERPEIVEWAVDHYTRSKIDFSDLLIAEANRVARCAKTVTFDKDAAKYVAGMELLR